MGVDVALFVSEIYDEFLCSICKMVLENPVQSPCAHVFCSGCINKWLAEKRSCPKDQSPLSSDNLKPSPRYFCNLLQNLQLKCQYGQYGCTTIVSMENLQSHLAACTHNLDEKLDCDGCNSTVTRREYRELDCLEHLQNKVRYQHDEFKRLTDELTGIHQEQMSRQRELVEKLNRVIDVQTNVANFFNNLRRTNSSWNNLRNTKISSHPPIILEPESLAIGSSMAQLCNYLSTENNSFKMQIIDVGDPDAIGIGLSQKIHTGGLPQGFFGYSSSGMIAIHGRDTCRSAWKSGDIIEIGMNQANFQLENNKTARIEVFISLNGNLVVKTITTIPLGGFYPTVIMRKVEKMQPKILYLP